ncbi:hypothetical protein RBI22_15250 [Alcaligenaceae bacterium C4P045]|nr:hypothetical protein [Alcaligenaceae bacterium C4P045]
MIDRLFFWGSSLFVGLTAAAAIVGRISWWQVIALLCAVPLAFIALAVWGKAQAFKREAQELESNGH